MSTDPRTIAAYSANAADYATRFGDEAPGTAHHRFADLLPRGGHILDYGCGPGRSAAIFQLEGFSIDAFDATPDMVELAQSRGVPARLATFDDLDATDLYDGIWANFALLHAPRDALPRHIGAIAQALRPRGILHIGMKLGTGEHRDRLDRLYTFVSRDELADLLADAGFSLLHERIFEEAGLAGTVDPGIVVLARHG